MSNLAFENACYDFGVSPAGLRAVAPATGTAGAPATAAPTATTTSAGIVKQAVAMANIGAAPTQAQFNNLLQILRDAGILAP